jgi:hypothetical protein
MQKKFEKIFFFKNFELFRVISPNATRLLSGKKNQAGSPVTELHFDTKLAYTFSAESQFFGVLRKRKKFKPPYSLYID